jgi:hypothetical protein
MEDVMTYFHFKGYQDENDIHSKHEPAVVVAAGAIFLGFATW